jgi:hypothetical protein
MRVPTDEELAAIAVAYLAVTRSEEAAPRADASRWALSARLPLRDVHRARFAAHAASRWNAAGRLDG